MIERRDSRQEGKNDSLQTDQSVNHFVNHFTISTSPFPQLLLHRRQKNGLRHYNRPVCEHECSGPDEIRTPGPLSLVGIVSLPSCLTRIPGRRFNRFVIVDMAVVAGKWVQAVRWSSFLASRAHAMRAFLFAIATSVR